MIVGNKIRILFCIFLFTIPNVDTPLKGQVTVEISREKAIISGTSYYMHNVKKGETAYSISRAYGITTDELTRENPPALYGVREGQILRIPVRDINKEPEKSLSGKTVKDEARYFYHRLQPGETIYFLSKTYGVSENDIVTSNPGIDITKLPVGYEIAIPKKSFMTSKQEFTVQDSSFIFHKVSRGESMSSIAEKYGVTLRELRRENRDVRFPQVGDYLRIPVSARTVIQAAEPVQQDTSELVSEEKTVVVERPAGFTPVNQLEGSVDVAVLLPFYLRENADRIEIDSSKMLKGKKIYRMIKRPEEWIYPRSIGFVEMYEGILLAADTLRSLGLEINLHVFDIKSDTADLINLIKHGSLDNMDLIIGPVYSSNLAILTPYANRLNIPVISPVPLFNNSILSGNPNLFLTNSSMGVAQDALARKASQYYDHNFVFIHADSTGNDPDVKDFKNKIFTELTSRIPYDQIRFKELLFYSRSAFDNDSINRLSQAMSDQSGNIVIIASEDAPVISETLMDIHSINRKFDIKVFGYPSLRGLTNLDPKYFFDLDVMVYSPYWIDYSKEDIRQFNSDFRRMFLSQPSEMSYAWLGYDIAYYFISGLAIHKKDFISHPEIHNPDLLQTEFEFFRNDLNNGFENHRLFLVRYSRNYEVELLDESDTDSANVF